MTTVTDPANKTCRRPIFVRYSRLTYDTVTLMRDAEPQGL